MSPNLQRGVADQQRRVEEISTGCAKGLVSNRGRAYGVDIPDRKLDAASVPARGLRTRAAALSFMVEGSRTPPVRGVGEN
jgi:hypothetical protein